MKYIDADKLINSNYLVKTPINKLNNKIINSEDKNILLIGKSGSGKTVTLKYMEKLSMNKKYKVIYTRFDSIINLAKKEPNELYSKEFFDHYYEMAEDGAEHYKESSNESILDIILGIFVILGCIISRIINDSSFSWKHYERKKKG